MFYNKAPHPANFAFLDKLVQGQGQIGATRVNVAIEEFGPDTFRLTAARNDDSAEKNLVPLVAAGGSSQHQVSLTVDASGHLELKAGKTSLLKSVPGKGFGVCAAASIFCFEYHKSDQYFGLGEKAFDRLEVSQMRTKFWNTDALGDFPYGQWKEGPADPYYVSIPYVILRRGDHWIGLLLHNPCAAFIDTGSDPSFFGNQDENRMLTLGAEEGLPLLYVLVAKSLAELTARFNVMCGLPTRPPLWAMGYHQCRWGYDGEADLLRIDEKLAANKIPNHGIWLDIDYMDGYRVFTYSKKEFPRGVASTLAKLAPNKRVVCPIIDPGVKDDPNYEVFKSGVKADIFCKTPEGGMYRGFVWPGLTVYPDFSMPEGRAWWAEYAAQFLRDGWAGAWLDMNDPSTGAIDPSAMLFRRGTESHLTFRNQYALGMQMATRDGFLQAAPEQRPFLLSRSGYVGTSGFSAIWTGDNVSTRYYLRAHIPQTLNLGMSGIPFCGNDIGGFANDTQEKLMLDWVRGYFLLPFFRIHSMHANRPQEPWTFSATGMREIRRYIRLRYRLLPYLYNLMVDYTETGHPLWRPVQYHHEARQVRSDVFLVGEDVFQAPFLEEDKGRDTVLPGRREWFDARTGAWTKPGRVDLKRAAGESPLWFRDGAIVPTLPNVVDENTCDLREQELHFFSHRKGGEALVRADDGVTMSYGSGAETVVRVQMSRRGDTLSISTEVVSCGHGELSLTGVVYSADSVFVNGRKARLSKTEVEWTGGKIAAWRFKI
ncbi:MAG: hypothetical protein JNJ45_08400 [Chthonomonas sp.]|nr:hypothetical protein [Chthonomonas sp.]